MPPNICFKKSKRLVNAFFIVVTTFITVSFAVFKGFIMFLPTAPSGSMVVTSVISTPDIKSLIAFANVLNPLPILVNIPE